MTIIKTTAQFSMKNLCLPGYKNRPKETLFSASNVRNKQKMAIRYVSEPHHEKICLRGFRLFSHMQKVGFLMMRLICYTVKHSKSYCFLQFCYYPKHALLVAE